MRSQSKPTHLTVLAHGDPDYQCGPSNLLHAPSQCKFLTDSPGGLLKQTMTDLQALLSSPTEFQAGSEDTTVELPLSISSFISQVLHCYYEHMIQNVDIVPIYL